MSQGEGIQVVGAKEHNLKDVSVFIPRNKITVISGLSGSGKSSLAFDVIYSEGQRRYLESLSSYARQYVAEVKKPEVDFISGLSPSVAIDQKTTSHSPRSTVGTVTEVYDFLRLLFARVGTAFCPEHDIALEGQSQEQITETVFNLKKGTKFYLLSPVVQGKKGEFKKEILRWSKKGFTTLKVDGQWYDINEVPKLAKNKKHTIDVVIDRLVVDKKFNQRFSDGMARALELSDGYISVETLKGQRHDFSTKHSCPVCGLTIPLMEPNFFSFNNPRGACEECDGLGVVSEYEELVDGVYVEDVECEACHGQRLKPEVLSVRIDRHNIFELSELNLDELHEKLLKLKFPKKKALVAEKIIQNIVDRVGYIVKVGAGYLNLNRQVRTLSGGEVQRVRLARQVGSQMIGVLYVLDEPSIGLHPKDHSRLLEVIKEIRDRGNTVLMVEHDEETLLAADHLIDLGPGAGTLGGKVMAEGSLTQIKKAKESLTGQYLAKKKEIKTPETRRKGNGQFLSIQGAEANNLKQVNFKVPLGTFCGVSGVSGSGKSSLVVDTLYKAVHRHFHKVETYPGEYKKISGLDGLDKVIEVNQKPIGRTPRSVPATYIGVYNSIRQLYAHLPESKLRGYTPGAFSFNVKGGRCEECEGNGMKKIEMHFLPNVFVPCESCMGKRFNSSIQRIQFKGKSIADVLQMTVDESCEFFSAQPSIYKKIKTLQEVGLGYITLGQSSTTLSGGEAQRIKLAKELSKKSTGKTLFVLDEPTTGLHYQDIEKLLEVLHRIVDQGNTVLVIEHHLDFIKNFDYLFDMGPEGGRHGGEIVDEGTPEELAKRSLGPTGEWLKPYFN